MNALIKPEPLEVEVENFGPIAHAKVALCPMTVFIGPSNTGKSYLAILLYALHRFFSVGGSTSVFRRFGFRRSHIGRSPSPEPTKEIIAAFGQLAQAIASANVPHGDSSVALPDGIVELLRSEFAEMGVPLSSEILRCFGMDSAAALVSKGCDTRSSVVIRRGWPYDSARLEHTLSLGTHDPEFHTTIPEQAYVPVARIDRPELRFALQKLRTVSDSDQAGDDFGPFEYADVISSLIELMIPQLVGEFDLPAFYLPADRTGVMHAHSAVVSAMLDSAPLAGLQPVARTPMLSGVLADFLRQLIQIDQTPGWRRPGQQPTDGHDAGRRIERTILHGTIGVERSEFINYPQFIYRPDGWKENLPLLHASSMVSELAPVVLYLRHLVQSGNVLIIEEPESHLHPAMQVELTRQLAKLVQSGYRVIITTHSEWVLEELANIVHRSQLPPEIPLSVSDSDAALPTDQVGVWLFRPKPHTEGSEVINVPLDASGLYPSGFDDVAIALHNDWANISSKIGENE